MRWAQSRTVRPAVLPRSAGRQAVVLKGSPAVRGSDSDADAVGDARWPPTMDSCYGMKT